MQKLTFMLPVKRRHRLQFQKHALIHDQIGAKVSYRLSPKIHRDWHLGSNLQTSLHQSDSQSLLINAFKKSAAKLVINLEENTQNLFRHPSMQPLERLPRNRNSPLTASESPTRRP